MVQKNGSGGTRTHDHELKRLFSKIAVRDFTNLVMIRALPTELRSQMMEMVGLEPTTFGTLCKRKVAV